MSPALDIHRPAGDVAEKMLKTTIVIAGAGWFALFVAAHFAGERARKAIGGFAVVGPLAAAVLVAALLEAYRRIGDDDKLVFGAAITLTPPAWSRRSNSWCGGRHARRGCSCFSPTPRSS
jgi:hypothetical protein